MEVRLAAVRDLPQIKGMYQEIIRKMEEDRLSIWDEIYPCEFFADDIREKRLYLVLENTELVSAFALCASHSGAGHVAWEADGGQALYLDRLGVNTGWQRKGIGSLALAKAKETAKALGADCLRLFVVDCNLPAIRLYEKNGFSRADGVYEEAIDESCILREYGYEIKL